MDWDAIITDLGLTEEELDILITKVMREEQEK